MADADDEFTEVTDADISRVDLVDKAANGLSFLIAKGEEQGLLDADLVRELAKDTDETAEQDEAQPEDEVEKEADPTAPPAATGTPAVPEESAVSDELGGLLAQVEAAKAALEDLEKRTFTAQQRADAAKQGNALPDGSYPIENGEDLENAVHAVGRGSNHSHSEIHDHIVARAKSLGLADRLPPSWGGGKKKMAASKSAVDEVPTETVEQMVKAAVAEVTKASEERIEALEAELTKVKATPVPGGPVLVPQPVTVRQEDSNAIKAAQMREKAKNMPPDLAADYNALAAKLDKGAAA